MRWSQGRKQGEKEARIIRIKPQQTNRPTLVDKQKTENQTEYLKMCIFMFRKARGMVLCLGFKSNRCSLRSRWLNCPFQSSIAFLSGKDIFSYGDVSFNMNLITLLSLQIQKKNLSVRLTNITQ